MLVFRWLLKQIFIGIFLLLYCFQWYHEEYLLGRDLKLVEPVRCVSAYNFSATQNVLEISMDWGKKSNEKLTGIVQQWDSGCP